ncbi:GNAT family N-acetyltransferase [Planctomycetota bacterium]
MIFKSESIALRPFENKDIPLKVKWINDPQINEHLHYEIPLGQAKTEKWFQNTLTDNSRRDFVIETLEGEAIGLVGIIGINLIHRAAEIYIAIGEKEFWAKGVMLEAESIMIRWAFETLGLEKIWAQTRAENVASIITMKKMGFQIEGTLRQEKYISGQRVDVIRMGLLRHEFKDFLTEGQT